ncbi:MAG: hypothetical protein HY905_19065 [Deltaproteobacteria bacterium]|nr:hypothetical protein [Deltaproteobacteria bacterium]
MTVRNTNAEADLRACWNLPDEAQWKPTVLHRIAAYELLGLLDLVAEAVNGPELGLAVEGANALLYMIQSPDAAVRDRIRELKEPLIRPRLEALASDASLDARRVRALLGLTLAYLEDPAGLEPSLTLAAGMGYSAHTPALFAHLVARHPAFFESILTLADGASPEVLERIGAVLELVDWTAAEEAGSDRPRARAVDLARRILDSDPRESLRAEALLTWIRTGDPDVLERLAAYLDADTERARQDVLLAAVRDSLGVDALAALRGLLPPECPAVSAIAALLEVASEPSPVVEDDEALRLQADPSCRPVTFAGQAGGHIVEPLQIDWQDGAVRPSPWAGLRQILSGYTFDAAKAGESYVILDEHGYVATVRATDEPWAPTSCMDYCPLWYVFADYTDGPGRGTDGSSLVVAVGPVEGVLDRARVLPPSLPWEPVDDEEVALSVLAPVAGDPHEWRLVFAVDLDGDGESDVESWHKVCGCYHQATETRVRTDDGWVVAERNVDVPLPLINSSCT